MKKIGLYSFFVGTFILILYTTTILFKDSDVSLWIKIALTFMFTGMILIISNQIIDRKKEKEEKNDSSKY